MFGLSVFAEELIAAALALMLSFAAGFGLEWHWRNIDDAAADDARATATVAVLKHQTAVAQQQGAAGQALADQAAGAFAKSQTQIRTLTQTQIQKIPEFIMPNPLPLLAGEVARSAEGGTQETPHETPHETSGQANPSVVLGVSNGFVLIHDAAVAGAADPAGLPGAAGVDFDAPAGIGLPAIAELLAENYGACHAAIDRAGEDESYILKLKLWYADVKRMLEARK